MPDTTTTTPGGGTDWGSIISGLISGYQAINGTAGKDAQTAANAADPWGPQRGKYQTQLNDFMADPSSIFKDPAFVAARNQGLEGVARTMGASGMGASGNNAAALYNYGDTFANQAEQQKFSQLATLAGVNAGSPAVAGGILAGGNANQNANIAGGVGGIASIISALTAAGLPQSVIKAFQSAFGGGGTQGANGITNNPGGPGGDDNIDVGGGMNPGDPLYPGPDLTVPDPSLADPFLEGGFGT